MAPTDERSIRLLNLVTALQSTSRSLTIEEIRERVPGYSATVFESFRRTFERDKDDLRTLGIDIEVVDHLDTDPPTAGYRVRRDRHELDDPGLTEQELASIVAATQVVRLTGVDPDDTTDAMRKLGGFGPGAGTPGGDVVVVDVPEHLPVVFDAVVSARVMSLGYRGRVRQVEGDGVRLQRGHWYLIGREQGVDGDRTYRVDRIESVTVGPPEAYERNHELRRVRMRPWEYGEGEPVAVTLELDEVAARALRADDPELDVLEDGDRRTVVLEVVDELRLFRFVASFLDRVEITSPSAKRDAYTAWLVSIAGDDSGDDSGDDEGVG